MRKIRRFAVISVLALMSLPSMAASAPASATACWQPAFLAGDADAVAKCYAADAVFWLPGVPTMRGRAAIREGYAGFFADIKVKSAKLVEMGRFAHGDEVSTWGTFTVVSMSKKDGKEMTEHGRYTDVSRRIDGRWVYLVDHASDDPPATPGH
ncbi:nuclear transport factor 2 family protein [Rhodanobacter sp. AS-Z3]|uniref:YybH family protein n=1 Tax=Rhodanobacter sp. AS-Z3 TaxID=3031330 RepID=UPI0024786DA4|nr:nuclear transport factor 2 family protein [Rhodanobacter sp. AS-Z3]WEN14243.1 nuclear transport factor 2 family protein [Rhodanobacter sp. AS-Z3]